MKEDLLKRLELVEKVLLEKQQALGQANADLNVIMGVKQELMHIISLLDAPKVEAPEAKVMVDAPVEEVA